MNSIIANMLRKLADDIQVNNTNASEDELMEICDKLNYILDPNRIMSKYEAAKYLHISRATFDNYVSQGLIPKGIKSQGWTQLK